ncbi:MAG: glycoside hydrolase family 127 protein [Lentisphaeria bacterium]
MVERNRPPEKVGSDLVKKPEQDERTKDGIYTDAMERALYNGVLSGVSLDGKRFFYANRLAVKPEIMKTGHHSYPPFRQDWFGCSCCPPNIARLLASFGTYIYSRDTTGIWVNLYAAGSGKCEIGGERITIEQQTAYPWKEKVEITVRTARPVDCSLNLRIPHWCRSPSLSVNGQALVLADILNKGYAGIRRRWQNGDSIQLFLPMPVEVIEAHPFVRHDSGKVALQRGPIVYCLEEADNGKNLERIFLPEAAEFATCDNPDLLGGVTTISTEALVRDLDGWEDTLYRPAKPAFSKKRITAVPYYAWANRLQGEMLVWMNRK